MTCTLGKKVTLWLPGRADLPPFQPLLSELPPLSARTPALRSPPHVFSLHTVVRISRQICGWTSSYRIHGFLRFEGLSVFDGLHFLLVFSQHPGNKRAQVNLTDCFVFFCQENESNHPTKTTFWQVWFWPMTPWSTMDKGITVSLPYKVPFSHSIRSCHFVDINHLFLVQLININLHI